MHAETKNKGAVIISLVVLVAAFVLHFYVDVGNMMGRWQNPDFSYCYLVPVIFAYLVYSSRKSIRGLALRPSAWGFVVLGAAVALQLMGRLSSIETVASVGIWLAIVALALLILGRQIVKKLAFPFLVLFFIVPLPPFLNNTFTFKLKLISSALSVEMMHWVDIAVFRQGNIIDLGVTQLQVVDACSGLRYVYPLFLMALVFAHLFHRTWWERVIVVAAAVPISVISNALRIAITGYLTIKVSPQVADSFFHGFSGWLIFMVSFLFLAILSWILKRLSGDRGRIQGKQVDGKREEGRAGVPRIGGVRSSYVWMASGVFVASWLLNSAVVSSQVIPQRKAFETFPMTLGGWTGEKTYIRDEILDQLWSDDYVQAEFRNPQTGNMVLLFVPYYEYQGTMHTAHSPVACLVGGGYAPLRRQVLRRDFPDPFGPVEIRQMVFERGRDFLLSNYWFQQRGRVIASEYWNKWYIFWDAITKRRTDGALVRLEMPLRRGQDLETAQAAMDALTQDLMKILPAYVPN